MVKRSKDSTIKERRAWLGTNKKTGPKMIRTLSMEWDLERAIYNDKREFALEGKTGGLNVRRVCIVCFRRSGLYTKF